MTQLYEKIKANWLFWALLLGALLIHIFLRIQLMERGFVSASADEFSRGLRTSRWAANPTIELAQFAHPWLVLELYVNGLLMRIWANPFWVPRLTVFAASCAALFSFVWLSFLLFESRIAAVATAYFLVFFQWFAWLSATPMLEMYYMPFYVLGLAAILHLVKGQSRYAWLWGGICMFLATSTHVQSWLIIATTLLCTLPFSLPALYKKDWHTFKKWFGFYLIAVSFVGMALFAQWWEDGVLLGFLSEHTTYSLQYYEGYDVPIYDKWLYYPRLAFSQTPPIVLLLLILAIWSLLQEKSSLLRFSPLILSAVVLALFSYSNLNSGPPSAAPHRYSFFYNAIFIIYAGYGFDRFVNAPISGHKVKRLLIIALIAIPLLIQGRQQYTRILNFPKGMPADPVFAGIAMKDILNNDTDHKNMVLELSYLEFLAVEMMVHSPENIIFDREKTIAKDKGVSILTQFDTQQAYQNYLQENQIGYVILHSPDLIDYIDGTDNATLEWEGEQWRIYRVD